MKIVLSGAGGSGKTTLAKLWADLTENQYLNINTESYMPKGVNSHLDLIKLASENPKEGIKFQEQLLVNGLNQFTNTENYISDRSTLDYLTYFLLQNSPFATEDEVNRYVDQSLLGFDRVDITLFLNPKLNSIEDNGVRTGNPHYFKCVSASLKQIIVDYLDEEITIGDMSTSVRISKDLSVSIQKVKNSHIAFFNEPNGFSNLDERFEGLTWLVSQVQLFKIGQQEQAINNLLELVVHSDSHNANPKIALWSLITRSGISINSLKSKIEEYDQFKVGLGKALLDSSHWEFILALLGVEDQKSIKELILTDIEKYSEISLNLLLTQLQQQGTHEV